MKLYLGLLRCRPGPRCYQVAFHDGYCVVATGDVPLDIIFM